MQNTKIFIQENAFENIVCEMAAILSWGDQLKVSDDQMNGSDLTRIKAYKSSGPKDGHQGPLSLSGLSLIPVWMSNPMLSKAWVEITYPLSNFNGCTFEGWD